MIECPGYRPTETRLVFWADSIEEVNRLGEVARQAGALNLEAAGYCPEYSPTYYATYFEDPSGNRLEVCYRLAARLPH